MKTKPTEQKKREVEVGDDVLIEQAWEDVAGHYYDEVVTVSKIMPDGTLRFRIGHWKSRTQKEQRLQAYLNKQEWYPEDVQKV